MTEFIPFLMFLVACLVLMAGYPVAFSLAGTALLFALVGTVTGHFDMAFLQALPNRLFGTIENTTLIAVPLFILMGVMLEKSRLSEDLLESMADVLGGFRSGLGISVVLVGALLAASTGIVGATVVTMGLMSLPTMLKRGYSPSQATGVIAATGTLGQIIPPSIALVLLGDTLSSAYQQAQLNMGIFTPKTVSIGDLFVGAIIPGLILVVFYCLYIIFFTRPTPAEGDSVVPAPNSLSRAMRNLMPPIILIVTIFSLVFRGFGGEEIVEQFFVDLPGGVFSATLLVMVVIFLLGFILDFIEITFVVVPIVGPVLLAMGLDPVWLGVMIAINLQTSFLTPPFGFALFYLRGVAPDTVETSDMYRGVVPFIIMQIVLMLMLSVWPQIATWLPELIYK